MSIKGMKTSPAQNKAPVSRITCPELHAINTKIHVSMSHPIRALCHNVI